MTESREHFALDWIRREIDETLRAARSALEAYAESEHDETKMRACLTYLHQVHGTLLMLELTGVTLLSDEMEQLAQAMLTGGVRDVDGAKQLLMQAILQLPAFLEEIQKGRADSRRAVLPLANELRGARGERLFDDPRRATGALRATPAPDALRRFDEIDGGEKARRIRAAYQQVLLSVLKGEKRQAALTTLAKVAVGLQRICERTPSAALWRAFAAYVASLADNSTELSGDVVRLLRRVDAEMKSLAQGGAEALNRPLPVDLVKQLIEAARAHGAVSAEIEELAGAIDLAPDEDHVAVSKREAIQTAAAALREELASVKDALDLFVRSDNRTGDGLLQLTAPLKQIGSTLSILGFESSRAIVADQLEAIQQAAGSKRFDDSLLLGIASALLQVDENLAGIARQRADTANVSEASAIIGHAQIAVLEEARSGLEQIKQAVVDYVSAQWDVNRLTEVPTLLAAVKGALAMVPLARPAEQLTRCLVYVNNELLAGNAPDWTALDAFADAISGIDYHLERLCENTSLPGDEILDLVERSLAQLGYGFDSELARRPLRPVEVVPVVEDALPAEEPAPTQARTPPPEEVVPEPPAAEPVAEQPPAATPSRPASFELVAEDLDESNSEPVSIDEVDEAFDLKSSLFDASAGVEVAADAAAAEEPIEARSADGDAAPVQPVEETKPEPVQSTPAVGLGSTRKRVVDTTADIDDDILEIFIEEVGEVLDNIDQWLPQWESDYSNEEALTEVRRAFHTLKGSGRIVGANVIGELAWSVENMLNRVLDETMAANAQIIAVTREGRAAVPALRDAFERRQPAADSTVAAIMDRADVLASGGRLEDIPAAGDERGERLPEPEVTEVVPEPETAEAAPTVDDSETANLFESEAETHLAVLEARFAHADSLGADAVSDEVVRALHTLRGSASMAGVDSVARIAGALYEVVREVRGRTIKPGADVVDFIQHGVFALRRELSAFADGRTSGEDVTAFDAEAKRIVAGFEESSPAASSLLQLDGASVLLGAQEFVSSWHIGAMDLSALSDIVAALHELRNEAESQGQRALAALCDALIETYERLEDHPLSDAGFAALTQGHERLLEMFDAIAADAALPGAGAEITALSRVQIEDAPEPELSFGEPNEDATPGRIIEFPSFVRAPEQPGARERPAASSKVTDDDNVPLLEERAEPGPAPKQPESRPEQVRPARASAPPPQTRPRVPADADPEILEIFFEEADELLDSIEQCIQAWLGAPENRLHLETLLRSLHTLKGGARLAGLTELGDEAHGFESFLIGVQGKDNLQGDFFDALQARHDELVAAIAALKGGEPEETGAPSFATQAEQKQPEAAVTPPPAPKSAPRPTARAAEIPRKAAPSSAVPVQAPPEPPAEAAESDAAERQAAGAAEPREQVRVAASLLEQLVNLAGESSIIRSRVEQGVSDFAASLEEMETTIERMREQLRRLEIETEAQVLFRQEAPQGADYEEFDPLEMDRYSQLQQLSRSLSESASDMLVLKDALTNKARESETLLLQQARVNTELQEGLMRTRMVPFSRLLPRLRRTVRQVARDLDKEIDFHAYNAEGELDRNVLERMIPPLEHMLRNAVDHGVEAAEVRRGYGKPAKGRIDLRLSREAGDVVIEISDDGAGIDVESVRAKAVERGLMSADARLRDEEILQFVLAPGFSTAKSVTQISGRGVGMDVVHSAVKQLGGGITIASIPGKGTRFTVRLPFTVSVNRALMVTIGEDQYAIPLNTIEGIVRVSGAELARLYEPDGGGFEYAGVPYRVRYLGSFIGRDYVSLSDRASVPVVLVRSGDRAVAVHVDGVQGSREIVVKSLGAQFAGVAGISGATILGDGSVVVILDLVALIRAQTAPNIVNGDTGAAEERPTCVMVVDDSVTVRKVTSRLLERQGMDVMVAKDGVEAMALLQERRPDIMLLDIEMPRMDGFEVARQIRHDDRLSKLPIVMISSRTGVKHQERAVELGVDRFLGKPFQENELLATIEELVDLGD